VIRINLLPQKNKSDRSAPEQAGSQKWLLVVLALIIVEVAGLMVFHQSKEAELEAQRAKTRELQGQISTIQQLLEQHAAVKKDLEQLRAREAAIAQLETARSGPTAALLELSQLLTTGKGPTVDPDREAIRRKDSPLQVFNAGWDARRVWLKTFKESNHVVQIDGFARDSTDVSELAYRLKSSVYFYDVRLLPGQKGTGTEKAPGMVEFGIELKVRY
jgi:type IV pilus assembly protein PilN